MVTSKFIKIPALEIGTSGQWILHGNLKYSSDILDDFVIVPIGFETDLASIPRIFTPIIPKNGNHRPAAIVHDWLCRKDDFKRKTADKIFREAMKVLGVRRTRRYAMYYAVRIGAVMANRRKENEIS